jgi:hypothetical protein
MVGRGLNELSATLVDIPVRGKDLLILGVESVTDEEGSRGAAEFVEGMSIHHVTINFSGPESRPAR